MWQVWFAALAVVFVIALLQMWRSVKQRLEKASEEMRENRALDTKIFRLYHDIEEMLDSFEAYVGEVHEEMESRRNELLTMSRQATTLYMQVMQPAAYTAKPQPEEYPELPRPPAAVAAQPEPEPQPVKETKLSQRDKAELEKLTGKGKKIRFLMGKGLNIGEIARELNIGKGEVRLILDLDKD